MRLPSNLKKRELYLDKIEPFIGTPVIKVITGQRRVGKSYLMYLLIEKIQKEIPENNIIYINCEDISFSTIKTYTALYEEILKNKKNDRKNFIFIDEIQDIPEFEKALRSLLLQEDYDIYITGGNAKMLSGELATLLSGRYVEFPVYSLSYPEFISFHGLKESEETLEKYADYGGLPYLIHLELKGTVVYEYLKNIYNTIVFRDIVSRYNVRNTQFLEKLLQFLSDNIGNQFSAKNISDYLKSQSTNISVNQVLIYINYLVNAFIVHRTNRYDITGKRIFEFGEKYYFENTGIRNVILGGYKPKDRGKMLENLIYNHLRFNGYKVYTGALDNQEIDFVCEKNGERKYIQAALTLNSEKVIEREFGNLMKIKDHYPKAVVTMDPFTSRSEEGISHIPVREFLMNTF